MREYRFPLFYTRVCYISVILLFLIILIGLINWMNGLWFAIPLFLFWIPLFVYFGYKNGTGFIKYDENFFEIRAGIWGGSRVNAEWKTLKEVTIQRRFNNIILNFGKNGHAVFGVDRLEFKLFALQMLKSIAVKKEFSDIAGNLRVVKDLEVENFHETDKKQKKIENKTSVIQIVQSFSALGLMLAIVMICSELNLFSKIKRLKLFAPLFVVAILYLSNYIVSFCSSKILKNIALKKNRVQNTVE